MATVAELIEQWNVIKKELVNLAVLIEGVEAVIAKDAVDIQMIDYEPVHSIWSVKSLTNVACAKFCMEAVKDRLVSEKATKEAALATIEAQLQPPA